MTSSYIRICTYFYSVFFISVVFLLSCKKASPSKQSVYVPPVVDTVSVDTVPSNTTVIAPIVYDGYTLIWNDEFNDPSIDEAKWNLETGTGVNGDFGTGQLDRATARSENASIKNGVINSGGGCLSITARKEYYIDRNYTSARLNTSGKATFGPGNRIEARIWARDVLYKGQGFAFWMMPAEKPENETYIMWPQGGEIDIMEYVGSMPFHNLGSVHYAWAWENNTYQSWNHGHKGAYYSYADTQVPVSNPGWGGWPTTAANTSAGSGGFHVYRIDWFNDRIEFAIDEHVYHIHYFKDGDAFDNGVQDGQDADGIRVVDGKRIVKSEYSSGHFEEWFPFEHKFYLILTAGVGGSDTNTYGGAISGDAVFPCSTFIDWVRVYKRF